MNAWFSPERRQAIQVFAGSLAPILIMLGFGTDGFWEQCLIILGAVLQFLASVVSLSALKRGDWGAAWTTLRGALYTLAAVASPSLVLLGLYDEATNATILTGLSLGLAALSNLVAIFVGKQQQLEKYRHTVIEARLSELRRSGRSAAAFLPGLEPPAGR